VTAFTYAYLHAGALHTIATDTTGVYDDAHDFATRLAALPHPRPVDEVWVWEGTDWLNAEPAVRIDRRNPEAAGS
jgi:hypothetical protein